jgi:hypothetical protein
MLCVGMVTESYVDPSGPPYRQREGGLGSLCRLCSIFPGSLTMASIETRVVTSAMRSTADSP